MMYPTVRNGLLMSAIYILSGVMNPGQAQKAKTIGLQVQGYPAGVITTLRGGLEIDPQQEISLRVGYNLTRRGDFGEHDNEEGGGPGFSLGYRYYVKDKLDGFFLGARTNLWFLEIDWRDDDPLLRGTTDITVLQPTAEVGYNLVGGRSSWLFAPVVSLGWELNVRTDGEEVGEGAIFLAGINVAYLF
jgi:hypothetical protein